MGHSKSERITSGDIGAARGDEGDGIRNRDVRLPLRTVDLSEFG